MFETMYLGSFSGMCAGMAGTMIPTDSGSYTILWGVVVGTGVWLIIAVMNRVYRNRSTSHAEFL